MDKEKKSLRVQTSVAFNSCKLFIANSITYVFLEQNKLIRGVGKRGIEYGIQHFRVLRILNNVVSLRTLICSTCSSENCSYTTFRVVFLSTMEL